jgi:hypothetical protein
MIKKSVIICVLLVLSGCASPTMKMSDQQIASLSDDHLCSYKRGYREEARLNEELARRGLLGSACDPYFRECLRRGNQPETEAMNFCMDVLHDNARLRRERDWYDNRAFLYGGYGGRYRHGGLGVGMGF